MRKYLTCYSIGLFLICMFALRAVAGDAPANPDGVATFAKSIGRIFEMKDVSGFEKIIYDKDGDKSLRSLVVQTLKLTKEKNADLKVKSEVLELSEYDPTKQMQAMKLKFLFPPIKWVKIVYKSLPVKDKYINEFHGEVVFPVGQIDGRWVIIGFKRK